MSPHAYTLLAIYLAVLLLTVKPLGLYIAKLMQGRFSFLPQDRAPALSPVRNR